MTIRLPVEMEESLRNRRQTPALIPQTIRDR
jgi:hypothetical protein